MANPLVTVLVDTYNHERFIEEAIVSVLEQDFPRSDMEILVVDDGSTDRTPEILRKFEPDVRVLRKANGGQASAFNAGIPQARGDIVAFLDGDDWWAKNKLSRVVQTMAADPALGVVGNGIVVVQPDGRSFSEILREGFHFRANIVEGALLLRLRKSLMGTSRMTLRKELLREIGPVPEQLAIQADEYLFTLAAALANAQILPDVLTFYRIHGSNGFQIASGDANKTRRKRDAISALIAALSDAFDRIEIDTKAREVLLQLLRAEVSQMGLMLDGGWGWETAATEWTLYRVLCPDAPLSHRLFKLAALSLALPLPPQTYYRLRRQTAGSSMYRRFRAAFLDGREPRHVELTTYADRVKP